MPLLTNCCHCRWCQCESGSSFALNAFIELEHLILPSSGPSPEPVPTSTHGGAPNKLARCPTCWIALWSDYGEQHMRYVRVGTLDRPKWLPPGVHTYTASKQPWVVLPQGTPAFEGYPDAESERALVAEGLRRRRAV